MAQIKINGARADEHTRCNKTIEKKPHYNIHSAQHERHGSSTNNQTHHILYLYDQKECVHQNSF